MRKLIVLFIIFSSLYPKIDTKHSTIIEAEEAYTKYKDIIQFNYLITQNYIYLSGLYDKENYYCYNLAKERWAITKDLAQLEMNNLTDKAYKIAFVEINYNKIIDRELNI